MPGPALSLGFFGKLPARGDFVRAGLPRGFVSAWDGWLSRVLPLAVSRLGHRWAEAPSCRFRLGPSVCGPDAACGALIGSVDAVGRSFPLTIALVGQCASLAALVGVERVGCAAVKDGFSPDELRAALAELGDCPTMTATNRGVEQAPTRGFNGELYRRADAPIADAALPATEAVPLPLGLSEWSGPSGVPVTLAGLPEAGMLVEILRGESDGDRAADRDRSP